MTASPHLLQCLLRARCQTQFSKGDSTREPEQFGQNMDMLGRLANIRKIGEMEGMRILQALLSKYCSLRRKSMKRVGRWKGRGEEMITTKWEGVGDLTTRAAGPGGGRCFHCCWRCYGGRPLGAREETISSSTCHRFANVQGTLALFGVALGLLAPVVLVLHWRALKF